MKKVLFLALLVALSAIMTGCDSNASSSSVKEEEATLNLVGTIILTVPKNDMSSVEDYKKTNYPQNYSFWGPAITDKNFKVGNLQPGSIWEGKIFTSSKAISFEVAQILIKKEIDNSGGKAVSAGLESLFLFPSDSILLNNKPIFAFDEDIIASKNKVPGIGWDKKRKTIFTWDWSVGKRSDFCFLLLYPKGK